MIRPLKLTLAGVLVLAACNAQRGDVGERTFEAFDVDSLDFACTFYQSDAGEDRPLIFATLADNPDNEARVKYGGETLRLVPTVPLDDGLQAETTYAIVDYAGYEVQLSVAELASSEPGTDYAGTIEMPGLTDIVEIEGRCAA